MIAEPRRKFPAVHVHCEMTWAMRRPPELLSFTVSRDDERVPVFSGPYLPSVIGGPGLGVHRRRFHNNQTSTNSSTPKRGDIIPGSAAPKPLSGEVAGTSMQSVDVGGDAGKVIWKGR